MYSESVVDVLLVSPSGQDHQDLRTILRNSNWRHHAAGTRAEALAFLMDQTVPVVICEAELPDGSWKDLMAHLDRMDRRPMLIVASRFADDRLWSEALNVGAYNVLAKPLDAKEVLHVVSLAGLFWMTLWERQQPLARTA